MREDIAGGLRNALERGENLENAVRTFINAGYSEKEVRDAAEYAVSGTLASLTHVSPKEIRTKKPVIKQLVTKKPQNKASSKNKSPLGLKVFILGGALLILAGILVSTLFFREQILAFFTEKFG
jgi:hypothetical protein